MPWDRLEERWAGLAPPLRAGAGVVALLAAGAAIAGIALALIGALDGEPRVEPERVVEAARAPATGGEDPFAYSDGRREELEERATLGSSHVLYVKSPSGVLASAERTAGFREPIEEVAAAHDLDPDLLEAIVFLESAGRPQVIAGDDPEVASGLAQILAETGTNLLGMSIDLGRSRELTRAIARTRSREARLRRRAAEREGREAPRLEGRANRLARRERRLVSQRAAIDERFDPRAALEGMATYLGIARGRFGRDDLAVVSYHMGIGNLTDVIRRYIGDDASPVSEIVDRENLNYTRLFFDSSPLRNERAWSLLSRLGDQSATYLWRVYAARAIMDLWRDDRDELRELIALNTAKATAEEAFHPESETEVFDEPEDVVDALEAGRLVPIPTGEELGFRVGRQLGELAEELDVDPSIYRSLRPEALAALIYITAQVQAISDREEERLIVTSATRDRAYQAALVGVNPEATDAYSLHTTGWSFDILRRYGSRAQAEAFQFVLDRMKALGVIDYAVEPAAIHVTVSELAEPLVE